MQTVVINSTNKSDLELLLNLAKKLGMGTKTLSKSEQEDWALVQKIEEGMQTSSVSRKSVMKALGK
jgi:arginine/ornithine N-succinyltransferase beta subunit